MNNDRIEGNWKEMKGKIQQKWGKLTDDDMDVIDGRREELVGKIQQAYGKSRDEAERSRRIPQLIRKIFPKGRLISVMPIS